VRVAINKPFGEIYKSDVEEITILNLQWRNITNLKGIEYFAALTPHHKTEGRFLRHCPPVFFIKAINNIDKPSFSCHHWTKKAAYK